MSTTLGTYSFLPWLRQGIAGQITAQDGDPSPVQRASVHVQLKLSGERIGGGAAFEEPVDRNVQLYGPGDIVGIDRRAIVRREPRDWITNFEPNYLAHIEFYDEDFPWRYTPAAPDGSRLRLRPWITLIVLEEGEFIDAGGVEQPLASIDVLNHDAFPNADDLWAWAHVHVNRPLAGSDAEFTSTDMGAVLPRLRAVLAESADLAYSRLVCPRRLKPLAAYHAFVVPTFEAGRLAGLGQDPAGAATATASAWGAGGVTRLPYYDRWYFHSGTQGDFEYLVRLLKPGPVDKKVGVRDIDVRTPGSGLPGISDADLHGILKLGGALRVPRKNFSEAELKVIMRYEQWANPPPPQPDPPPHPFQSALAAFVNLADDYAAQPANTANAATAANGLGAVVTNDPDPLITAPIYGRWHALTQRLLVDRDGNPVDPDDNWVHELNLDPRHRLAAGFGTRVVQQHQEEYMQAAWEQVGDILEANRRIRLAQLASQVAVLWHSDLMVPLAAASPQRALALTAPVQARVRDGAVTVRYGRAASLVPPVLTSVAMRRITRPGSRLMRALPFDSEARPDNVLDRVNAGEVSAAPPKVTPPGVVTTDEVADLLLPSGVPRWILDALDRFPWLQWLPLLLALLAGALAVVAVATGAVALAVVAVIAAVLLVALWLLVRRWATAVANARVIREKGLTPEAVDALPSSPDFVITRPGSGFLPTTGATDSVQAKRFKDALRDWHSLHAASAAASSRPAPAKLDLGGLATTVVTAIDPSVTVPGWTFHAISLPAHIAELLDLSDFGEVMAYPEIDVPMYEPLKDLSDELFLPNLNLIGQNTITLLETNQKFIEAYMIGNNHELARELLWREYPTDQRGSYFRQFWDARGALTPPELTPEQRKELLRDIPPINRWRRRSSLGDHDNRETGSENEEELVLAVRGELLKKYPNAVIYAQKATWALRNGKPDPSQERSLIELTPAEEEKPPPEKLKTPLYEARVSPDITFFGFDLTDPEARGDTSDEPDPNRAGWFFVIKERPGEPRMGFDLERDGPIQTVNDLAWPDTGTAEHASVSAGVLSSITLAPLGSADHEKDAQRADDLLVVGAPQSAARWAYLLYQVPVMIAVHATEMLEEPKSGNA
jgi:hypothetical protein